MNPEGDKDLMSSGKATALRWLKFNAVGGIGIVVQLASLQLLISIGQLSYLVATALAVEATIIHNFFWHERFTWADRGRLSVARGVTRFLKFNLTTGVFSIAGNVVLMRLFVGTFHLNYLLGNLLTIATCSIVNFAVSDLFVFRLEEEPGMDPSTVSQSNCP